MHPNRAFHWDDRAAMGALIRDIGFGMVFAATPDGPRVAHVPLFLTDDGAVQWHLARGNALTRHLEGTDALIVVNGPDAYVSPDDYQLPNQVPTWNYLSVELEGPVRRMDDNGLHALLTDLSAAGEASIAGKTPWTMEGTDAAHIAALKRGIVGFEMEIRGWRGTAKLGQNKPEAARHAAADALDARGRRAVAHLMRQWQDGGAA